MSNLRPIIVRHKQNDACLETANYLRNKRWIVSTAQALRQEIQEHYQTLERDDLDKRTRELRDRLKRAVKEI